MTDCGATDCGAYLGAGDGTQVRAWVGGRTGLDWITRTNWPAQTGGGTLGKPSPLTTSRNWLPGLVRGALNKCLPFLSVSGTAVPTVKVKGSLRAASALPPDPARRRGLGGGRGACWPPWHTGTAHPLGDLVFTSASSVHAHTGQHARYIPRSLAGPWRGPGGAPTRTHAPATHTTHNLYILVLTCIDNVCGRASTSSKPTPAQL